VPHDDKYGIEDRAPKIAAALPTFAFALCGSGAIRKRGYLSAPALHTAVQIQIIRHRRFAVLRFCCTS
jgi:hypothetical protein